MVHRSSLSETLPSGSWLPIEGTMPDNDFSKESP